MKYLYSLLFIFIFADSAAYKAEIIDSKIVIKNGNHSVYSISMHSKHLITPKEGSFTEIIEPSINIVGSCLLLEYGASVFDAGDYHDPPHPGNIYMYDIRNKKYVGSINNFMISQIASVKKGDLYAEIAYLRYENSGELWGSKFIKSNCEIRDDIKLPEIRYPTIYTIRGRMLISGFCLKEEVNCMVTLYKDSKNEITQHLYFRQDSENTK